MLSAIEFLAEPRYKSLVIEPQEDTWHCVMTTDTGDKFMGYGANGYQAFLAMLHRYRDTDPDTGPITMTVNPDRKGQHRKDRVADLEQ